ncbi:hypothetical protein [Methanosarcina mazei]|uniref:hypothetical protein n=1 Tax=Methanosarcina mazei TaxID=2209 RepID=UPI000A727A83|nr:hypothetical protein [Methanosarcina mazei]
MLYCGIEKGEERFKCVVWGEREERGKISTIRGIDELFLKIMCYEKLERGLY